MSSVVISGDTSGTATLTVAAVAGTPTLTLPTTTDTLVGKATTDTFTNKTFDTAGAGNVFKINGTSVTDKTGSGKAVLDTSPTLVTPLLGTPTSGNLTNCTLPAGTVIQTVQVNYNTHSSTSSATPSASGLTATITPKFSSSKILIIATANLYNQAANGQGNAYIYKATTQLALIGQIYSANAGYLALMVGSYLDSPATTSPVTYNVYFSAVAGTVDFNVNNPYSTLILMEIQQ